jgi:uncharacterized protein YgiM (DUF1202 family)
MAKHEQLLQNSPEEEKEPPRVFHVSQDQDGSFHIKRRDFLLISAAMGGAILIKGVCPRFGAHPASETTQPVQAGMIPSPRIYLHAGPSIDSNIVDTLHPDDMVLLISDQASLGWVEVSTQSGQRGWLDRDFVDFSRAIRRSSRDLGPGSAPASTPTPTPAPDGLLFGSYGNTMDQNINYTSVQAQTCGEALQNGDFEAGHAAWVETSSHGTAALIINTWADPQQGAWVARLGGVNNAVDLLSQNIHLPADVDDIQILEFYLKVTTTESSHTNPYDKLILRLLDASGTTPIHADIPIADSTAGMDWTHKILQISGLSGYADQDIQLQFKGTTDSSNITNFVIDSVSLNLGCGNIYYFTFLPLVIKDYPPPTKTPTPTRTASPTKTPCASYTCSCNTAPCTCNTFTCSCNSAPCSCNAYPCTCDYFPCVCNFQ